MILKKSSISRIDFLDILFGVTFLLTASNLNTFHIKEVFQVLLFIYIFIRKPNKERINKDVIYRILFTIWCGFSIIWSSYQSMSIIRVISTIQTLMLFFSGIEYISMKKDIRKVANLLIMTAGIYTIGILLSYPISQIIRGTISTEERIRFLLINPNIVGIFLVYGAMTLIQFLNECKHKWIVVLLSGVFVVFAFFTGSKKAFLTCIIGVFLIMLMKSTSVSKWVRNVIIGASVIVLIIYLCFTVDFLYMLIGIRLESLIKYMLGASTFAEDKSTWGRGYLIQWAKEIFLQHPILGVGIGNFQYMNPLQKYAHNNYWELLANLGFIGFILYYIPFIKKLILAFIIRFKEKNIDVGFPMVILITIMLNDYANVTYTNESLTLLIGCVFCAINIQRRKSYVKERNIRYISI